MISLASCYRTVIPAPVRAPVWYARRSLGLALRKHLVGLRCDEEEALRRAAASFRLSVGLPVAKIRADGFAFRVDLRDQGIGRPLYLTRSYEPSETALLRRLLGPGMVFVDVGANIGYYAVLAGHRVGPTGKVLAVEPDPHNFRLLRRNIAANALGNVQAVRAALGDRDGVALLRCSSTNFGDHRIGCSADPNHATARPVELTTFDKLVDRVGLGSIDVVKMDVQGYEHHVVAGMAGALAANRRIRILTEFWPHGIRCAGGDPEQFFGLFTRAGFRAAVVTADGPGVPVGYADVLKRLPPFDPEHPDRSYINILFYRA